MTPADLVLTPMGLCFHGRRFACSIGRGGLSGDKREGDGATPRGTHTIVGGYYRADRIARPAPWLDPIGPGDLWSDDPNSPTYNSHVRAPYSGSHEKLFRADRLYDLVLVTDWNWPRPEPGRGSAIFLHRWRKPGHPTEGCIALAPHHLLWLTRRLQPGCRVIVA
ncbi:L,D-transpeptidase family protein [Nioella aestuarii]|uniref:L,D-transpeptidase family protein n=1 Tax=Nioella aestuarii TaxID=1662864 RepID=UPI003D7FC96C